MKLFGEHFIGSSLFAYIQKCGVS